MENQNHNASQSGKYTISTSSLSFLLVVVMAITIVTLVRNARGMRAEIETLKADNRLHAGESVPSESFQTLDGGSWAVNYLNEGLPTILYVFTPKCAWCQKNTENANSLATQVAGRYRFIGISLSSDISEVKAYIGSHFTAYPVYIASPDFKDQYRVSGTPTTILIGRDGRVVDYWLGAYTDEAQRRRIEDLFGVHLASIGQAMPKPGVVHASE